MLLSLTLPMATGGVAEAIHIETNAEGKTKLPFTPPENRSWKVAIAVLQWHIIRVAFSLRP
jgi:hypothetical protein